MSVKGCVRSFPYQKDLKLHATVLWDSHELIHIHTAQEFSPKRAVLAKDGDTMSAVDFFPFSATSGFFAEFPPFVAMMLFLCNLFTETVQVK